MATWQLALNWSMDGLTLCNGGDAKYGYGDN